MVVALLALSLVMILGGVAAVVQGFPYVRLESGLAMVIGGSTAASAGVILLGLSAVVDRLRRVQRAVIRLREEGFRQQGQGALLSPVPPPVEAAPWLGHPSDPVLSAPPVEAPSAGAPAGAAGLAGLSLGAIRPGGRGTEPVFEDPAPVVEDRKEAEPLLPDLLPEAPSRREDEDLFAAEPASSTPEPRLPLAEGLGLRPALDLPVESPPAPEPVAAAEPAKAEKHEETPAPEPERHAVGSYASGANTYVMFSDGSIEADTPRGRFTFGSLDELKTFVNAGGEETRGAA